MSNALTTLPADLPRIIEYGSLLAREYRAEVQKFASAVGALHGFPVVDLEYSTAGYECAGSMLRRTDAYWAVRYMATDGGIHGKRFAPDDEDQARAYFAKLTSPEAVAEKRREAAWLEETVYAPAREQRRLENEARAAAERERKNALARYRRSLRRKAG